MFQLFFRVIDSGALRKIKFFSNHSHFIIHQTLIDLFVIKMQEKGQADNKENYKAPFFRVVSLTPLKDELKNLTQSFELRQDSFACLSIDERTFIEACCNRNLDEVQAQLDKGVNINIRSRFGITALGWVCRRSHIDLANLLLDRGAGPNVADSTGVTPLIKAVKDGDIDLMRLLLDKGADVNMANIDGINAVMCATLYHKLEAIKVLAEHGSDLNAQTKGGYTPLMNASRGDQKDAVKLLLDLNADIHITNEHDTSHIEWHVLIGKSAGVMSESKPEFGEIDRPKTAYDMAKSYEIKELIKAAQHRELEHVLK